MANLRVQTHTFTLHYLYPIDANGGNASQCSRETQVLAELLLPTDADDDDEGESWFTPPAGFEVEEVNVTGAERLTDQEEHNLGHGQVTLEVRGHSYRTFPIDSIAAQLRTYIHAQRAVFTPDLALVARDDYWQMHVSDAATRLPCVIIQHEGTSTETSRF